MNRSASTRWGGARRALVALAVAALGACAFPELPHHSPEVDLPDIFTGKAPWPPSGSPGIEAEFPDVVEGDAFFPDPGMDVLEDAVDPALDVFDPLDIGFFPIDTVPPFTDSGPQPDTGVDIFP